MPSSIHLQQSLKSCKKAFRANILPAIILQAFALLLLFSYYYLPATRKVWESIGDLKDHLGWIFAIIFSTIFGAWIPYLALLCQKKIVVGQRFKVFLFYTAFWAYSGLEVDLFYNYMGFLFGDQQDAVSITKKVLCDQFIYSFLWTGPRTAILFLWKDLDFNLGATIKRMNRDFFWGQMPAYIFSIWLVWIPAVSIIYSLPMNLQFPMFNIVLCFFVLLVSSLQKEG